MHQTVDCKSGGSVTFVPIEEDKFGFKPGQLVHFTKSIRNGKVALIRGVCDGLLWFSVFSSIDEAVKEEALNVPVDTSSCRVHEEFIRQYGWVIDDRKNLFIYKDTK
ncbi:unnamed protein product [Phytomonas sp. Hart1]|nr:unnamed protein product [Phytomonas sp. Hart1]|eukprot:CCW66111.1 unnamed protein product [Phytomonas sp. isolate Hart1]